MEKKFIPSSQQPITRSFCHSDEPSPCAIFQFFKIHFNIVHPSTSRFSKWPLLFMILLKSPVRTSSLPTTCHIRNIGPSYRIDHPNNISSAMSIMKLLIIYSPPVHFWLLCLRTNYFVSTLISNTLRLLPPSVWQTKLYAHTTQHAKL